MTETEQPTTTAGLAELFAQGVHAGQTDKQGRDYFTYHLRPVATMARVLAEGLAFDDEPIDRTVALAWLHDSKEDQGVTDRDLWYVRLDGLASGLDWLTHAPDVPYQRYVEDLARSAPIEVVVVKLADNLVNSTTLDALPGADRVRLGAKYGPARQALVQRILRSR
jgi:(p)ppGpp synthase/HD superfamily hydrolase